MWNYYKKTFVAVQLVTGAVSWSVYRSTNHLLAPAAIFFVSMQVSAFFGAMWASRLRRKMQMHTSGALN
jgi:hypothetical protein